MSPVRIRPTATSGCFLLVILLLLQPAKASSSKSSVFQYNVCNGLSNQLLIHASAIAKAIQEPSYNVVQVPDYFIVNGEQTSEEHVLPWNENSVPLAVAFDVEALQQRVQELGIRMELVRWDTDIEPSTANVTVKTNATTTITTNVKQVPDCPGLQWLSSADPQLVLQILKAFQPSSTLKALIDRVVKPLQEQQPGGLEKGVCFHHRDGADWHDHCQRWSALSKMDGIYRGNCEAVVFHHQTKNESTATSPSLLELLQHRALSSPDRWIYYCGDHQVPTELKEQSQYSVVTKDQLLSSQDKQVIQELKPGSGVRDLWALIDFYICGSLHYLVGNSVSTFSALQVALREQEGAYWYNSQSIPLGDVWNIYQIPIVYTYTEQSDAKGKYMLQASIASVRQHMPQNKIYILYNGKNDTSFRHWLQRDQNVTLFQHDPEWKEQVEQMRQNGNAATSHLFLHHGNYMGTWQRIDIPKFIETEYCLLLDADTVIMQPFTLNDFGLNLTQSIGMSAERHRHHVGNLLNAGVTLMNVPFMRATYDDFLGFILDHIDQPSFSHPAPSDQGAYLDFYQGTVQQISNFWNWKAYWGVKIKNDMFSKIKILHFHGIKPHDYVKKLLGQPCGKAIHDLCQKFKQPIFRFTMQRFLLMAASIPNFHRNYCESSFDNEKMTRECVSILERLKNKDYDDAPSPALEEIETTQTETTARKRRLSPFQEHGFWDGDHTGLNTRVVTVSRVPEQAPEEEHYVAPTTKVHELSYDYLRFSDEMVEQQAISTSSLLMFQIRMLLITSALLTFFLYVYLRKNRRVLFVLVCGSVTIRHIFAFAALDHGNAISGL